MKIKNKCKKAVRKNVSVEPEYRYIFKEEESGYYYSDDGINILIQNDNTERRESK